MAFENFPPEQKNQWCNLDASGKTKWLDLARKRWFRESKNHYIAEKGRTIELPGELIRCELDFYCAIGEAVNGPGGYFGAWFHGFDDCLFGGFGLEIPYEIIWKNSKLSKRHLDSNALEAWLQEDMDQDDEEWAREVRESWQGAETLFDVLVEAIGSVPVRFRKPEEAVKLTLR
ncbi:barstar family protein [Microbulbifer hydrolyticus]|uniref:Uncharacterized protein n=1 Tax=Microbulbifer hydrolyticus TaxID=48074 RepID=A0A6P1T781_9GAMM|nr:barstar family protein [Microbulbifer hydrolyticus]MBB5213118.1 hypothetical protein [Microbulbifer hydrolyticus]QHQ38674.1 hypothetical protein GTQ55_06505 [Microbulbifer hydrolyticus]